MASIAVFIALGGSSYAAVQLSKNSVRSEHITKGQVKRADLGRSAVDTSKVKDGSLLAADFAAGQLPAGAKGDPGARGPAGADGAKGDEDATCTGTNFDPSAPAGKVCVYPEPATLGVKNDSVSAVDANLSGDLIGFTVLAGVDDRGEHLLRIHLGVHGPLIAAVAVRRGAPAPPGPYR